MDHKKQAEFARRFGKRLKLKKGGVVQHFAPGGTILGGPSQDVNQGSGLIPNIRNAIGLSAQGADIQKGTNAEQLNNAYSGVQNALNNQIGITNTLTPQVANAASNQNAIAAQELAMSRGEGPNPAANQLAQATGANVANQAALMAAQRGASANPALLARQAAMQGAQVQQGAAGQAATMGSQQQINAQNNLANLSGNQINQAGQASTALNTAQQNEQQNLLNANAGTNANAVAMQSNINNNNSNANSALLGGITSMASSNIPVIGSLFAEGGEVGHHGHKKLDFVHKMTKMGLQHYDSGGSVTGGNSDLAKSIASTQGGNSNINSGVASSLGNVFKADGGQIQSNNSNWAGSYLNNQPPPSAQADLPALKSMDMGISNANDKEDPMMEANKGLSGAQAAYNNNLAAPVYSNDASEGIQGTNSQGKTAGPDISKLASLAMFASKGGNVHPGPHKSHVANFLSGGSVKKVPAMVSPGEVYLSPEQVKKVINEGIDPISIGHRFKGKAKVKGDSLKNDNIPVDLEEGGVIIDRKNMDTRHKRELFVHKSIAKHKAGGKR